MTAEQGNFKVTVARGRVVEAGLGDQVTVPSHHPESFWLIPNLFEHCPSTKATVRRSITGPYAKCDDCYREWPIVAVPLEAEGNPSESC